MNTRSAQLFHPIEPLLLSPNRTLENKQQERKCSFSSSNHFDPTIISKKSTLTNLALLDLAPLVAPYLLRNESEGAYEHIPVFNIR